MKPISRALLWTLLLLLILFAIDQLLLRVPVRQPILATVRSFYLDFRTRLSHLRPDGEPHSIEAVIERAEPSSVTRPPRPRTQKKAAPAGAAKNPKYFYADAHGELHFADSWQEIPEEFRREAQRLEE